MGANFSNFRDLTKSFHNPPALYSVIHWWIWTGSMTKERICCELDRVETIGIRQVLIGAGHGVEPRYLSREWFERIQFAVKEAKKRDMKVWIADEGSYPSGFAGGEFTRRHPHLCMKALVIEEKIKVESGTEIVKDLSPNTIGILAIENETQESKFIKIKDGMLNWTVPKGDWQLIVVKWDFRTSPTRYVHHPTGAKDTTYSLCDYLDKNATYQFLQDVHERYKEYIGDEFGETVLGFFGDEPDYSIKGIPWTPGIFDKFKREKGYEIEPYIPYFFKSSVSEEIRRAKADYWDVWSAMFCENFFKPQVEWCEKNHISYIVHLNHEDMLMQLTKSEGDFFRCMRYVHIPAIDVIWRQIWMDKTADFPKLASSAAHLFGRKRAFSESFAVYGRGLSIEQAKWVVDHQAVRGINFFLTAIFMDKENKNPLAECFPYIIDYIKRVCYLLSSGEPAVQTGLYFPTLSMWLEDEQALKNTLAVAKELLEQQMDFDFVDEQAICSDLISKYRCIIVPSVCAISKEAIEHLRKFALEGKKVVYLGDSSPLVVGKDFLHARDYVDMSWSLWEPSSKIQANVLEMLSVPDVKIEGVYPSVKYTHRRLEDGEFYFFFNEKDEKVITHAILYGSGKAQIWDVQTGKIRSLDCVPVGDGYIRIPLILEPFGSKSIAIGESLPSVEEREMLMEQGEVVLDLSDELWNIKIGDDERKAYLLDWKQLGHVAYSGAAYYSKEFKLPENVLKTHKKLFLECERVMYTARTWVNGKDLGYCAWRPFRWDITRELKSGTNILVLEIKNTPVTEILGDAAKAEKLRQEALNNFYLSVSIKFDMEMVPSGLLGPVRIVAYDS